MTGKTVPLYIVCSPSRCVGKTLVSRLLTEFYLVDDRPVAAFDLADEGPQLADYLPDTTTISDIGDTCGQMAFFDRLLADSQGAKVIDVSHRTFRNFFSVVMVSHSSPAKSVKEFLETVKQHSGKLILGTDFIGTFVDVDTIMLAKTAGLKVAYHPNPNGANGVLADLVDGKSNIAFLNVATSSANIDKFKPLAVTGARRLSNFPDTPTMAEAGYPGIGTPNWQGLFAPRRLPGDLVARLHHAAIKAMSTPEARAAFDKVNAAIVTSDSPSKFTDEIKAEMTIWQRLEAEVLALPAE
jgi:tripartite tricarboxylate transporter family receptor